MKKQYIYLLGIASLGFAYQRIKEALDGGTVFAGAILCIVLVISWLAHRFGNEMYFVTVQSLRGGQNGSIPESGSIFFGV